MFCPDAAVATVVSSSLLVYDCSDLQPETSYEISVSAVNSAGNSSKNSMNVTTACNFSGSVVVEDMVGNMFNISVSNCTKYVSPISTFRPFYLIMWSSFSA